MEFNSLQMAGTGRLLSAGLRFEPGGHNCGESIRFGARGLDPNRWVGVRMLSLKATDGVPLSHVPDRYLDFGLVFPFPKAITAIGSRLQTNQTVRRIPSLTRAEEDGSNPHGPAISADGGRAWVSTGELLYEVDLRNSTIAARLVAEGAYPDLSPDGSRLVVTVPTALDSTVHVDTVPFQFVDCIQETRYIAAARWEIVVHDLASGVQETIGEALEARYLPDGRMVVVTPAGLGTLDPSTGTTTPIPLGEGGRNPVVMPDGRIAFTADHFGNPDVFYLMR